VVQGFGCYFRPDAPWVAHGDPQDGPAINDHFKIPYILFFHSPGLKPLSFSPAEFKIN
jgi:hypothetical protein